MHGDADEATAQPRVRATGPVTPDRRRRAEPPVQAATGSGRLPAGTRRRLLRIWMGSTVIVFFVCALWSLATPVGAAPDEPTQIVKAAAVVRGELTGTKTKHQPLAVVRVTVPKSFANDAHLASCYAGRPTVPAGCAPHLANKAYLVTITTYVGRYPPLYYLLVGVPTLLWHTNVAVYAMRWLGALWSALLLGLALAVAAVLSRSKLLVAGVAVAVTPLVMFLASVVNPSGLEIAAAVATWTTGLVLVLEFRRHPPPGLVVACAASASVLVLCRGLSPLWLAAIAATLVALVPGAIASLWQSRPVKVAAAVAAACGVVAVAFIFGAHTLSVLPVGKPLPPHTSRVGTIAAALGRTGAVADQAVGVFGWLDTPSPLAVLAGWWIAVAVVVVAALIGSRRRHVAVLVGLMVLCLVLPTAIIASQAHKDGLVWQARDGMPLYVGIPLVAAAVLRRSRRADPEPPPDSALPAVARRRLLMLVVSGVALAQLVDFAWALRRYTVGLGTTLDPLATVRGGWSPPVPAALLLLGAAAGCAVYGWWLHQLTVVADARVTAGAPATVELRLAEPGLAPAAGPSHHTTAARVAGSDAVAAVAIGNGNSNGAEAAAFAVTAGTPDGQGRLTAVTISNASRGEADRSTTVTDNPFCATVLGTTQPSDQMASTTAVDLDGLLLSVMTSRRRHIRH